jgi:hypothetical protein
MKKISLFVAILAGALSLVNQPATACCEVPSTAVLARAGGGAWIQLHRPDGDVVHVRTDQIVFVMSTSTSSGSDKRAQTKLQLVNGFCDVRESVDEVMQLVRSGEAVS